MPSCRRRSQALDGGALRCERAKADRRVTECRGTVTDPELGGTVDLWVSAIDSVAGIITLSSRSAPASSTAGARTIERRYGRVGATRAGRAVDDAVGAARPDAAAHLAIERGEKVASVSLVDGRVLDAWDGRDNGSSAPASEPDQKASLRILQHVVAHDIDRRFPAAPKQSPHPGADRRATADLFPFP